MYDPCPHRALEPGSGEKHKLIIMYCELGYKGKVESRACVCHTQWLIFPVSEESMVMGVIVP